MIGDAQRLARLFELVHPPPTELVCFVGGDAGKRRHQDFALFAERAGDQGDVHALRGVHGHGRARTDRLVVGMRMDE